MEVELCSFTWDFMLHSLTLPFYPKWGKKQCPCKRTRTYFAWCARGVHSACNTIITPGIYRGYMCSAVFGSQQRKGIKLAA